MKRKKKNPLWTLQDLHWELTTIQVNKEAPIHE